MTEQPSNKDQAALFAKLSRAMGAIGRLPKSGYNDHFKYDFVTDGDVSDAVRAALASENVAFFASMRDIQVEDISDKKRRTKITFIFTFADGETGATWACDWGGEALDSQDKGTAKAATSALKYFLLKNFVLSSGDPRDDSDNGAEQAPKKEEKLTPNGEMSRGELIYTIKKLNKKLAPPDKIDQTWLKEATETELTAYGMQLRERVNALTGSDMPDSPEKPT